MIWACFAEFCKIYPSQMQLKQLMLDLNCVTQQDNDLEHSRKFTTDWLKKNQGLTMAQSRSRPQCIEILWQDLKGAVHNQMPENLNELKEHC